ncbi:hypothetical protein [Streptomyces sp. G-G2]|uniref:hypothetical protein n=1 Tax=Streptomyces sp. G-G2 TaxID=3046201 RepID=UPI0024BB8AD3|nr:hypothetical protein [Streptomyces sp. G-G2]MDJ0382419.1 hypothetical protein [Streptomyces sp. G-G2]
MAWKRRRSAAAPQYDPAFGDKALSESCQDIKAGRWQGPRDLLAAGAPNDWDRRSHRIRLLANAAADSRVVEAWQASEPDNPDAVVLRADTEVMRMFAVARGGTMPGRHHLDWTAQICLHASEVVPEDPHPWVSLVTLARLYEGGHAAMGQWWQQLRARDPHHREGHHQGLRYMSARWHGSHGQAYNFARDSASYAPLGSALAVLPQAARAEQFRHRVETEGGNTLDLLHHWSGDAALWDLRATMERWLAARTAPAAQDVADLNYLTHGLVQAGLLTEAALVFQLLEGRATRVPWSYTGDPEEQYVRWRDRTR